MKTKIIISLLILVSLILISGCAQQQIKESNDEKCASYQYYSYSKSRDMCCLNKNFNNRCDDDEIGNEDCTLSADCLSDLYTCINFKCIKIISPPTLPINEGWNTVY